MECQDWICVECSWYKASGFCFCGGQETFLCTNCWSKHYSRNVFQMHLPVPISAYGQHRISGYFDRLQHRSRFTEEAKKELQRNLDTVDLCIYEFQQEVQKAINAVWEYGQRELINLQNLRTELHVEINRVLEEVEKTMHEDSPNLSSSLAANLRNYCGNSETLKFFFYRVDASAVINSISSICTYARSFEQKTVYQIAGICGNQLRVYNLAHNSMQSITLAKTFTNDISICFLSWKTLLCIGSDPPSTESFLINFGNSQCAEVASTFPLSTPRKCPGVISVDQFAYAFGSIPRINSCEQYNIAVKRWKQLSNMKYERGAFSPAYFQREIYLVTTRHPIEVFNIDSMNFRELGIAWSGDLDDCSSLFIDGELYIFTEKQIGTWKLGETSFDISKYQTNGRRVFSQCPPVYCRPNVHFIDWKTGLVNVLNLSTKVRTFSS